MIGPQVTELLLDDPRPGSGYRTGTLVLDGKRLDFEVNPSKSIRLWLHLRPFVKRRLPHGHRLDVQAVVRSALWNAEGVAT